MLEDYALMLAAFNNADTAVVPRPCAVIDFGGARLRIATRNALHAFNKSIGPRANKSGRMVDAALAYAQLGLPIFPVTVGKKVPIPRADPGKPGTGGFYKATTDPVRIIAWWRDNPSALIGLPMGERSGVWCLDVDTPEDHADGLSRWSTIAAQHEAFETREHRSATGGPHLIFNWVAEQAIRCGNGALPTKGISVKGQGGYIVMPPSRRKGRAYSVYRDTDPIDAPPWLVDLILQGRAPSANRGVHHTLKHSRATHYSDVDLAELADALRFVPNPDDWTEWKNMALRIYAAVGDAAGWKIFHAWSQRWEFYDPTTGPGEDRECWRQVQGSPPDRTGAGKIFAIARENSWMPKRREVELPAPLDELFDVEAARNEVRRVVREFFRDVMIPESEMNVYNRYYYEDPIDPEALAQGLRGTTGLSKTQITIEEMSAWLRAVKLNGPIIYAIPHHKLSPEIAELFAQHGINARVFYGREHDDPTRIVPGKKKEDQVKMCRDLGAVALAKQVHADITTSCCRNGEQRCRFYSEGPRQCGYQAQRRDAKSVQVWIVASDVLFHAQAAFGEPSAVIIDEAFWRKGIRGVEEDDHAVSIASLMSTSVDIAGEKIYMHERCNLGEMLQQQQTDGPLERKHVVDMLGPRNCTDGIATEWTLIGKLMKTLGLRPGRKSGAATKAEINKLTDAIRHAHNVRRIMGEMRALLYSEDITTSGRLYFKWKDGQRYIACRNVAEITSQFKKPTLLLDATLPNKSILQVYHPQVRVVADLKVAPPPHVRIRQVLKAPTSAHKLMNKNKERSAKHLHAVRRYVLQRWLETGRQKSLVICQKEIETRLCAGGLPENIHVVHYNNVTGLDDYRDVRLEILIGRTAPGPEAMEILAGALSGQQPVACPARGGGFAWYPAVKSAIALRDGRGIETQGDRHVDATTEAVRWLVHEGELMQALGRARPINRDADHPLDVDLLFDTCLPITVDAVVSWRTPSLLITTAAEGVMLTSATDLVRLWPGTGLWTHEKAAFRTLQAGVPVLPGFVEVWYQLKGPKMNRRLGFFDPGVIPDPTRWLAERLGPLADPLTEMSERSGDEPANDRTKTRKDIY